jgi:ABC-type proline/glycine betaine transport system substrate-binding protein
LAERGREDDPVAYAFINALELTEGQIEDLETAINEEDAPLAGARRWVSENRERSAWKADFAKFVL